MTKIILLALFCLGTLKGHTQEIQNPDFAFKSHETLDILKIVGTPSSTTLILKIASLIPDGSFCVDPNTSIILPGGRKLRLEKTVNIPNCPEEYVFQNPGESLTFSLRFPPLPAGTLCVDVVEGCNQNCFSIIGLVTDTTLNNELREAQADWMNGDKDNALKSYFDLLNQVSGKNLSVETGLFSRIIQILHQQNNDAKAGEWIRKLKSEKPPHYQQLLKDLKAAGIAE